jgi:hypothetical protein
MIMESGLAIYADGKVADLSGTLPNAYREILASHAKWCDLRPCYVVSSTGDRKRLIARLDREDRHGCAEIDWLIESMGGKA